MSKQTVFYVIDTDENITAFASKAAAHQAFAEQPATIFSSRAELDTVTKDATPNYLVGLHNTIPGVSAMAFDGARRQDALARIWKAIQSLEPAGAPEAKPKPKAKRLGPVKKPAAAKKPAAKKKAAKAKGKGKAKGKKTSAKPTAPKGDSKKAMVLGMCQEKGGATLATIMKKTGWQKHTVRGFMATVPKKLGLKVVSDKPEGGERTYSISK